MATFDFLVELVNTNSPAWTSERNDPSRGYNLNAALGRSSALAWLGSNCNQSWLQQLFGNTRSTMSRDVKEGRHWQRLLAALRTVPEAAIAWPSPDEMEYYFKLICQGRDSMSHLRWCIVFDWLDGLRSQCNKRRRY